MASNPTQGSSFFFGKCVVLGVVCTCFVATPSYSCEHPAFCFQSVEEDRDRGSHSALMSYMSGEVSSYCDGYWSV